MQKKHKIILKCQNCGAPYYGAGDMHYCPNCAKKKNMHQL